MTYNQTDILFASLVGGKVADSVPRFTAVQNELAKHVLPPIPFLPLKNEAEVTSVSESISPHNSFNGKYSDAAEIWQADKPMSESQQFFPFSFEFKEQKYTLPYEPMINISGGNTVIKREVAKAKPKSGSSLTGSIKERWNQKDYEITITGVLMGSVLTGDASKCFPRKDFEQLKKIITEPARLKVYCEPLQLLGIHYIVIESFSFPFTKGENVQAYEIKGYSDFDYNLLIDIDD